MAHGRSGPTIKPPNYRQALTSRREFSEGTYFYLTIEIIPEVSQLWEIEEHNYGISDLGCVQLAEIGSNKPVKFAKFR